MTDAYIIVNFALRGIYDAETDANSFADPVAEKQPVNRSHQNRGQQSNQAQYQQPEFAYAMHGGCEFGSRRRGRD
jgi:hypothetical protein